MSLEGELAIASAIRYLADKILEASISTAITVATEIEPAREGEDDD